jgi:superfamily II DNA or RNA helicase
MINLRPYQTQAIAELAQALIAPASSAVLVLPTGAGKTTVAAELARRMVARGKRVWFVAHLQELVNQARARMELFGLFVGEMSGEAEPNYGRPVQCCMVQTLGNRLRMGKIRPHELPDFIFFDEGHHTAAGTYQRVLDACPDARRIGLTATPFRLDGKGLGQWYADLIAPISAAELVEMGHLVPAKYYATEADLEGISTQAGEYKVAETYAKFNKSKLYAGVVNNYQNYADGRKAIVFCVNVDHSRATVAAFTERGIAAAHLDGETPRATRARILEEFAAGRWQVLSNVALFTEGFDLPDIGCVIINRPTKSKALYLQMVGRGLRPSPGKAYCVVIDHGSNVKAHGFFEDPIAYSLDDRPKKKGLTIGTVPVKSCPSCGEMQHAGRRACIGCGYCWPDERGKSEEAVFVEVTRVGGLSFLPPTAKKRQRFKQLPPELEAVSPWQWSREQWAQVRRLCGYKPGWESHQLEYQKNYLQQQEGAQAA